MILSLLLSCLVSEGWQDVCPTRAPTAPVQVLGRVALDQEELDVQWRDGATGTVRIVRRQERQTIRVEKRNDVGYVVVRPRTGLSVPAGARLRAFADCEADDAEPDYALGFLCLYAGDEDLSYCSRFNPHGRGGPRQTQLVNTAPGMRMRKYCQCQVGATQTNAVPAIVVAGRSSVSWWSDWGVEDLPAAERAWKDLAARRPVFPHEPAACAADGSDVEHTARVVREGGLTRLLVDGRETSPVLFKYSTGALSARGFVPSLSGELQVVGLRMGVTRQDGRGFWSREGFDVTGAVARVRERMGRFPSAKIVLSVGLDAYPEFADEHPDETWIDVDGRRVFGDAGHTPWKLPEKMNPRTQWHWVSNHSLVWREAVKANLTALVGELRRTGLAKRIVGVHLAGFHDAQFATGRPDYSKPAYAAFLRWQEEKYGKVRWTEAPKPRDDQVFFRPDEEPALVDYVTFMKQGPFQALEDLARHVKRLFAKDIVVIRYCMGAFGGSFNAAYDIAPFVRSDSVDILCAQPDYGRRVPGVSVAQRLPLESFHLHGKFFLNELDLRTYGASTPWESEITAMTYSRATDFPMWCAVNRKLAGQMYAKRMGWWYLDMAGGWFDPPEIRADIAATVAVGEGLASIRPDPWRSDVAVVADEEGLLLRNTLSRYYNPAEQLQNGGQMQVLGASGLPLDYWLMEDWLADPSLAERYRTIVFQGLYAIDARRAKLIRRLSSDGRVLVFLTGTGLAGGVERLGLRVTEARAASNETVPADGVDWNVASLLHGVRVSNVPESKPGDWRVRHWSPRRFEVEEKPGVRTVSRYRDGGAAAIVERAGKDFKWVYVGSYGGLTPAYLNRLAHESGAYVPTGREGLEVDMNGNFLSVHCVRPGKYAFRLPFEATVVNLKTGVQVPLSGNSFELDLTAGESRWYRLRRCGR